MLRRFAASIAAVVVAVFIGALPVMAQDAGYEPPPPLPTFGETDFPSDPPPTVPPGPPPTEETPPPPTTPPGPPPVPPEDPPDLPATGLAVTTGMALAAGLLIAGATMVGVSRRRRNQDA